MKQLSRKVDCEIIFDEKTKYKFYKNLKDSSNKIKTRWNNNNYKTKIRQYLSNLSSNECAFCGISIKNGNFDIEHYLPKERFPLLSYCIENYLPACKKCNQSLKHNFYPISLKDISSKLADKSLMGKIDDIIPYYPEELLPTILDRIIEPTYDNIEDHLKFLPESASYISKTEIGELTNNMFFVHREVVDHLQQISNQVLNMILDGASKETILGWSDVFGYNFYFNAFYEYWKGYFPN